MANNIIVTFNGRDNTEFELDIKDIQRSVLAPIENKLRRTPGVDGLYNYGSDFSGRLITITFHAKHAKSKQDLHNIMTKAAAWLFPLDRKEKELQISDEPNLSYLATVSGSTDITEILYYGYFIVTFICIEPFKLGKNKKWSTLAHFTRNSIAYDLEEIPTPYAVNEPRYFTFAGSNKGLMIEEGTTTLANNPLFQNDVAGVPEDYTGFITNATATHAVVGNEYRVDMTASSAIDGRAGIIQFPRIAVTEGQVYNAFVTARVISATLGGKARFRVRAYASDGNTLVRDKVEIKTDSATDIKLESGSMTVLNDEFYYSMIFESYADGTSGATAHTAWNAPQLELKSYNTSFTNSTRKFEELNFPFPGNLGNRFGIGITFKPNWGTTDAQATGNFRRVFSLCNDRLGTLDNLVVVSFNPFTKKFQAGIWLGGVEVAATLPGTLNFDAGDIIKIYFEYVNGQFQLHYKRNSDPIVSSGFVPDSRDLPEFRHFFIGSGGNNDNVINAIVRNVQLHTDQEPDAQGYFNS